MSRAQDAADPLDAVRRAFHSPRDYQEAALAADADPDLLASLATLPYPFVREAVATNPATEAPTLLRLVPSTLRAWADRRLVTLLVRHDNSDTAVIRRSYEVVLAALGEGQRCYVAAIALAADERVSTEQVAALGACPGASARLRRGLRLSRATRPD